MITHVLLTNTLHVPTLHAFLDTTHTFYTKHQEAGVGAGGSRVGEGQQGAMNRGTDTAPDTKHTAVTGSGWGSGGAFHAADSALQTTATSLSSAAGGGAAADGASGNSNSGNVGLSSKDGEAVAGGLRAFDGSGRQQNADAGNDAVGDESEGAGGGGGLRGWDVVGGSTGEGQGEGGREGKGDRNEVLGSGGGGGDGVPLAEGEGEGSESSTEVQSVFSSPSCLWFD